MNTPGRILVVNANWVGDALFSTPALRALKKRFPKAHLACAAPPRCGPVLRRNPYLDQLIVAGDDTRLAGLGHAVLLRSRLAADRFDWAVFFHRSKTKAWAAKLAGIPVRAGFRAGTLRDGLLTHVFEPPAGPTHRTDHYLALLEALGVPADGRVPDFIPDEAASAGLEALLSASGVRRGDPYVVVHPGGNWDLKRWPAGHFSKWIDLLSARFTGRILICGTAPEAPLADEILAGAACPQAVSLCGKTSLDELALLMRSARLVVSNDSGPIHLAASQGVRILGLFGPTDPRVTGPVAVPEANILRKDVGCEVPCYFRACDLRVCMEWITPEEAADAAMDLLHAS